METIAAIATPPGTGGVGIVRLSGPDAARIASRVFRHGPHQRTLDLAATPSHRLLHGVVVDPVTDRVIDEVLLGWMAGPHSYTGEDTAEFNGHGGPVPMRELLRALLAAGARHAEPGEFTLRAFLNGRIDLTQAEAVLNVIGARTSEALALAVDDLSGGLRARIRPARDAVISLLAFLDASADFPEDEIPPADVDADLRAAITALEAVLAGAHAGLLLRDGAQVALVGRPNVGKSSLLNALLRSDRAIVTPIAGTTRDVIAESIALRGVPVTLLDTAGIAETEDVVEQLGIERSRRALRAAAAAVLVLDGSTAPTDADQAVARLLADRLPDVGAAPVVIAINKRDLPDQAEQSAVTSLLPGTPVVPLSCVSGEGIPALEETLADLLGAADGDQVRPSLLTARQQAAAERALLHLREAATARAAGLPLDLMATDVRAAAHAIGLITGESVDDAVLQEIFSRFCIGK